ncbi:hypothetical protein N7493_002106 [Penicillium malachiteum]|uniref:Cysteine-rich transmembrane CYSTM domain-containing protein n=1 Tax=Penicillium malachiteum TaxID=1324776 RepID=A0AAD6HVG7_9EURO|nr:hypothetical protein N7493_002106 [Penicillium malachiteum]
MFNFNFFKSAPASEANSAPENTWNSTTLAMQQPSSPAAPSANQDVVSEQPAAQEGMQLRGGGGGDVCCGICAGIACFECFECCC